VEIVIVEEQLGEQEEGLKLILAPAGRPETTEKLTGSVGQGLTLVAVSVVVDE